MVLKEKSNEPSTRQRAFRRSKVNLFREMNQISIFPTLNSGESSFWLTEKSPLAGRHRAEISHTQLLEFPPRNAEQSATFFP